MNPAEKLKEAPIWWRMGKEKKRSLLFPEMYFKQILLEFC